MRELGELINVGDPAWPPFLAELSDSDGPVEILPADMDTGGSPDDAAHEGFPGLAEINEMPPKFDPAWQPDAGLVVVHDVLGGVFARAPARGRSAGRRPLWMSH
ncbi:hypothetical protein ACGFY9_45990 [Streptomyces sp. NPDC048504]|uniref:hypothetical protein n=1 Tax=Streptomyces sp. NPDC048504 TaxID=3365559 RepID=UPI003713D618